MESHLLQMRGLKQNRALSPPLALKSHLLQMRGLKLQGPFAGLGIDESHLLQMRGLKHTHEHKPQPIF